jgi:hypothetical protein
MMRYRPAYFIHHSPIGAVRDVCHHYRRDDQTGILTDMVVAAVVAIWIGFALFIVWEGV